MASYVERSACRGTAPKVYGKGQIERNGLINKLMKSRNTLRLLRAPSGFGKSVLAAQYANLLFGFKNCYWLDCSSPCFIRDLDSGALLNDFFSMSKLPSLVVLDDIPDVNGLRPKMLSGFITKLMKAKVEVIATVRPENWQLEKLQKYVEVTANELKFSNSELEQTNINIPSRVKNSEETSMVRIPCLMDSEVDATYLLRYMLSDAIPAEMRLITSILFLTGGLSKEQFGKCLGKRKLNTLDKMLVDYPVFDFDGNTYSTELISVTSVVRICRSHFEYLAELLHLCDKKITGKEASYLLGKFFVDKLELTANDRTCEIVRLMCDDKYKLNFAYTNLLYSVTNIRSKSLLKVVNSVSLTTIAKTQNALGVRALLLASTNQIKNAKRQSYKILELEKTTYFEKLVSILIFSWFGTALETDRSLNIYQIMKDEIQADKNISSIYKSFIEFVASASADVQSSIAYLIKNRSENKILRRLQLSFCLHVIKQTGFENIMNDLLLQFAEIVEDELPKSEEASTNYFAYLLLKEALSVRISMKAYLDADCFVLTESRGLSIKSVESRLFENEETNTHEDSARDSAFSVKDVMSGPSHEIKINVFGGLSVLVDGKEDVAYRLKRQKSRTLLTLLAIENGKEIGRSQAAKLIWPNVDNEDRLKNLNTVFSDLRHFLMRITPDVDFVIKCQNSLALNTNVVSTDISILEKLCDSFCLGPVDYEKWYEGISANENIFSGELLPSEESCDFINSKRQIYANRIIDSLVIAGNRLIDANEIQPALWFAQKAYLKAPTREDVYELLMRAQMLSGQRSSAIETYFACKKFLDEHLGLKPSRRLNKLYDEVIEG